MQRKTKVTVRKPAIKYCRQCGKTKPLADFPRKQANKNGRGSPCNACRKKARQTPEAKEANRKRVRQCRERMKPIRRIIVPDGFKRCSRCGTIKPHEDFGTDKRARDGLSCWCKECNSQTSRQVQARKYETDAEYNLTQKLQARVRSTLPGVSLPRLFGDVLPYSVSELVADLKSKVPEGWEWEDVMSGALQVDHKKPLCAFRYRSQHDRAFREAWKLSNLQLLPKEEHERKGATFNGTNYRMKRAG